MTGQGGRRGRGEEGEGLRKGPKGDRTCKQEMGDGAAGAGRGEGGQRNQTHTTHTQNKTETDTTPLRTQRTHVKSQDTGPGPRAVGRH